MVVLHRDRRNSHRPACHHYRCDGGIRACAQRIQDQGILERCGRCCVEQEGCGRYEDQDDDDTCDYERYGRRSCGVQLVSPLSILRGMRANDRYRGYKYPGQALPKLTVGLNALAFPALFYCRFLFCSTSTLAHTQPLISVESWYTSTPWVSSVKAPARTSPRWSKRKVRRHEAAERRTELLRHVHNAP